MTMEFVPTLASWLTPTSLFLLLNLMIGAIVIISRFGAGSKKHHPPDPFGSGHAHRQAPLGRAPSLIDRVKSINFHLYKYPSPETDVFTTHLDGTRSEPNPHAAPLARAPSLLHRVKSINFSSFNFTFPQYHLENDYPPHTRPEDENRAHPARDNLSDTVGRNYDEPRSNPGPRFSHPVDSPGLAGAPSLLERVKSINFSSFYRSDPNYLEQDPDTLDPLQESEEDYKPRRSRLETKKPAKKPARKAASQKMTKSASEKHAEKTETEDSIERRRPETARVERLKSIGDGEDGVDEKASDFINKFKQQLKLQRLDSILRYKEMLKAN